MGKHSEYEIQVFRVLDLLQNEREGRRGRADHRLEVAQRKQGLVRHVVDGAEEVGVGEECIRWRRWAAQVPAAFGPPPALTDDGVGGGGRRGGGASCRPSTALDR